MKKRRYNKTYWIIYNKVTKKYPKASKKQRCIITYYAMR